MTPDIKDSILLQHAFLGCDTVSRVFGMGKGKIMDTPRLRELCISLAPIFYSSTSSKEEIEEAGLKMMLALYNSKIPTLNKLRYKVFMEKVTGAHSIKPVSLPPTEDAARQHFLRAYHQIQTLLGIELDLLQYGWKVYGASLVPIFMTQAPASSNLLTYIHCGCKEDNCKTKSCSCVKHGVPCSLSCGKCSGVTCCNPQVPHMNEEECTNEAE